MESDRYLVMGPPQDIAVVPGMGAAAAILRSAQGMEPSSEGCHCVSNLSTHHRDSIVDFAGLSTLTSSSMPKATGAPL